MYKYVIHYTWMWNALFISPNLPKKITHLMHLDANHGLAALVHDGIWQQPASGSQIPPSQPPFQWFQFDPIPFQNSIFIHVVWTIAKCLFWLFATGFVVFLFIEFRFPKTTTFIYGTRLPRESVLCFATWCLSAPWNPWSGAQSNASRQRVSLAPRGCQG